MGISPAILEQNELPGSDLTMENNAHTVHLLICFLPFLPFLSIFL